MVDVHREAMHLTKTLLFLTTLLVSVCLADFLIKTSEPDDPGIIEAAVNILESCYGNRLDSLGLAGNLAGRISKTLWSRGNLPVTLIDDTAKLVSNDPVRPISKHKLQFFVVSASSSIALTRILRQIKASIWWNHMAAFLILDWPLSNDGCSNTFEMLWAAWKMNILNAKLMCYHQTDGRLIYTFNPYTAQAPSNWKIDKMYSGINNHPWTLFVRGYGDGEEVCKQLDFDKTQDLGGYEIRIAVTDIGHESNNSTCGNACIGYVEQLFCDLFLPVVNATPKILFHHSIESLGFIDNKGKAHGILAEVINGSCDISFRTRLLTALPNTTHQYPRGPVSLYIMTQYRGYKSQLKKIVSVVDKISRFGLLLVGLINILFFKYFLQRPVMVGYLNTILIICNAGLPKIPRNVAPRLYLGCLFLFAVTMQGIYQGQLASLLTKQVPLQNVNTMTDLLELDYTIYAHPVFSFLFEEPQFKGRFIAVKQFECTEYVLRDHTAACIYADPMVYQEAIKFGLHVSTEALMTGYTAMPCRPDWPLQQRFDSIYARDMDTLSNHIRYIRTLEKVLHIYEEQKHQNRDRNFKILTLEQLSFAFVILGVGLSCATISFVIELRMCRSRKRISRNVLICGRNRP